MPSRRNVPFVLMGALWVLGCRREAAPEVRADEPAKAPVSRPSASPAPGLSAMREALGIPANVDNFHGPKVTPVASRKLKNFGALGDLLEGDVFYFTAASVKRCGNDPGAPSGTSASDAGKPEVGIVGVEVEIKAKSKLTFSPREVRLQSGGVVFHASLDLERRLKGCTPQLKISWLKKDDVIKGFVLFDVPAPESKKLELTYQPTRWGGAGMVRVALPQCAGCAEAAPASR